MRQNNLLYKLNQREPHILILIIMSSFASMGAIIFTPALPEIQQYFNISQGRSQLTITLFLVGYALGQLVYGVLSNYLGRRNAFFIGIVIATIGSIISILSETLHSFNLLILGRMLEAFGSSAGLVLSFTIINDYYFPEQARRIISYVVLAFAIIPGIATFVGGILITYFHWISCFYFLLVYGLLIAIPIYYLEETATIIDKRSLMISNIKTAYIKAFKNNILSNTSLFFAMHGMCVYAYAASAPFIAIHKLHISPGKFGIIGLIPYIGTALGAIATPYLSKILSIKKLIKYSVLFEIISCSSLIILFYFNYVNLSVLVICGFLFMFSGCIIAINGSAIASSASGDPAIASSVMNFINISMGMCGTFILAFLPGETELRLSIVFIIALSLMVLFWRKLLAATRKNLGNNKLNYK